MTHKNVLCKDCGWCVVDPDTWSRCTAPIPDIIEGILRDNYHFDVSQAGVSTLLPRDCALFQPREP